MEYELKQKKAKSIIMLILSVVLTIMSFYGVYISLESDDMFNIVFAFVYVVLGVLVFLSCFNKMGKGLTFNNVNFTYNGKTYTYQQIERIGTHAGRYGSFYYTVYVDGKAFYRFDRNYECVQEFMYYLDFYKVSGTPRL